MCQVLTVAPDGTATQHWQVYDPRLAIKLAAGVKIPPGHRLEIRAETQRIVREAYVIDRTSPPMQRSDALERWSFELGEWKRI